MLNSWHFKYALLMSGLFAITVGYNACSNDAGFDLRGDLESIEDLNGDGDVIANSVPNPTIKINNDAEYTNVAQVNLSLDPDGPADSMFISNDSDCSTGQWEPYQANKVWDLVNLNQDSSVYVRYKFSDNPVSPCVKDNIIHDDIAPAVNFTQGVGSLWIKDRNVNVTFHATDSGSGVQALECDNSGSGTYSKCGNSVFYSNLQENQNYLLRVIATDKAGNVADPQQLNWRPDYTPPTIDFTLTPAAVTADTTPDFSFLGTDLGSGIKGYECKLDDAAVFTSCLNVMSFNNLTDGSHTLEVRAIDNVDLVSTPISYTWTQDTTAPTLEFTQTPQAIENTSSAIFAFREVAGGIVAYECKLDSGTYQACTSPHAIANLTDARHTFSVVGLDSVGNRSAAITYSWLVDTTPPTVTIVEHPDALTNSVSATFSFTAHDTGAGVRELQCRLDSGAFAVCQSTMSFTNLAGGSHSLDVKAIDLAGNESAVANYQWTIDNQGPTVQITSGPDNPTSDNTATFTFTATDAGSGIDAIECRVDGAPYMSCTSPSVINDVADGAHTFSVRARDNAGNLSNVETYPWTVDTQGPTIQFVAQPSAIEYIGSTPQVRFIANDGNGSGVASYACIHNGAAYACQGDVGYSFPAEVEGNNSFSVTATDVVGNSTTETITWEVKYQVFDRQTSHSVDGEKPVDILFVVDNSGSMSDERENLAQRIDGLLGKIGNLDWQIAVTTTDLNDKHHLYDRWGYYDRSITADWTQGRLSDFDGNGMHILDASMNLNTAQTLFENKVSIYNKNTNPLGIRDWGSGDEQGIYATDKVIDRYFSNASGDQPNRDFIRQSSDFVVVVLSDENEFSDGDSEHVKYQPQEFLNRFNSRFENQKSLTWHSIIVKDGDTQCRNSNSHHRYGTLYEELSNLTGGVVGSICENDYTSQLENIGQSVADLAKTISLECEPLDVDSDGQPDVEVTYKAQGGSVYIPYTGAFTIQGQKVIFDDYLLAGDYLLDYKCNQ